MRRGSVLTTLEPRRPGRELRRHLRPVHELDAWAGILAQEQVAVQVDVVAERGDAAPGRDAES